MTHRILIIEDEENIARVLQLSFNLKDMRQRMAHTGAEGLLQYREQRMGFNFT